MVVGLVREPHQRVVHRVPGAIGREGQHVLAGADGDLPGVGEELLPGGSVGPADVAERGHRQLWIGDPRRDDSLHVPAEQQHHRLVEGQHHRVESAEHLGAGAGVAPERSDALRAMPRGFPMEPGRMREVVQGHHRPQSHLGQSHEAPAIAVERRLVEAPTLRLDARPLQAHPERARPEVARQAVVLAPAIPVIHASPGDVLHVSGPLPVAPVVLDVTLDLIRGGRDAEDEVGREARRKRVHREREGGPYQRACVVA